MQKIIDFLKYPSTWQGIVALIGALGVTLMPEQKEAIITAGVAVVGAISLFFSDTDVKKE